MDAHIIKVISLCFLSHHQFSQSIGDWFLNATPLFSLNDLYPINRTRLNWLILLHFYQTRGDPTVKKSMFTDQQTAFALK
jgi:hypothetical protein